MRSRPSDTRQRVVTAAAEMLARHGLNATSIRETAKLANAPFGSTYHHFPDGKQQVVAEAVALAGAQVQTELEQHLQAGIATGLHGFLARWRELLVRSQFRVGCPVMAAAAEEPIDDIATSALDAAAQVFAGWEAALAKALRAHGHGRQAAAELATLIIASVEGAIVLCRAQRSIAPFDRITRQLQTLVQISRTS